MNKFFTITLAAFIFTLFSCIESQEKTERWEGFTGDKMSIVISEFFMPDEKNPSVIPEKMIKERVSQRASLLLACYVNINLPREKVSPESDALFNQLINESLNTSKTLSSECSENNYCTVITEFNIAPVNRELDKLK